MARRLGAYVLPGDTVWITRTLERYYPMLERLVVPVPTDGLGWNGEPIPVQRALDAIRAVDVRGILTIVPGSWIDPENPMRGDTAQRQAAVDELRGSVDWVLQLDTDELLPDPGALLPVLDVAESLGIPAVEWPMRVLFRRTRRWVFEVAGRRGRACYDYPGPVVVRPDVSLRDARRADGPFLRPVVVGDVESLQVVRSPEPGEHRWPGLRHEQAIIHNSWARSRREIRQKIRSWGHAHVAGAAYYWMRWLPTPLVWRAMRDFHPFARGLWPRLARRAATGDLAA